jgi:hypothetical protein
MDDASIHPAFAEVLRTERDSLNQRFALRRRAGARIDEAAFHEHLRTTVNDLATGVAPLLPERVRAVVNGLYDVSLDLFAAGLLGIETKHPHVITAWRDVLPQAMKLLARDPHRLAGCLSNAVDHLAGYPSARPREWIEIMATASPVCESVAQWLDAGKVAAWRCGLVQYRQHALDLARQLPCRLATCCFGLRDQIDEAAWRRRLERATADRWFSPINGDVAADRAAPRVVRVAGGFRGFGGPCVRPPQVTSHTGRLLVQDGDGNWELLADVFGTYWHRVPHNSRSPKSVPQAEPAIDKRGRVTWGDASTVLPELAEVESFASDGQTLAVTLPTSHHVFLVARISSPVD